MGRIEIAAFGSVRVRVDEQPVALAPRCLGVLARLMLARGRWVGVDELYRSVWSSTARVGRDERIAVQKAIAELRRGLDPDRSGPDSGVLLTDRGAVSSYRLVLDSFSVDLYRFEDLIAGAGSSGQVEDWQRALALWTDRPLRGVVERPFVREAVEYLIDVRGRACVDMVRAYARIGRASDGFAILDRLVAAQPDDVQLRTEVEQLRQEKVGWEPPDAGLRPRSPTIDVPAELPPQAFGFTGRDRELAALDGLFGPDDSSRAVAIAVVAGAGGVGKTALALQWAHQASGRFPDGQLYVDLRGFDSERPLGPEDVLARFLVTLGVRGGEMPVDIAARSARYRSILSGRRMLIVLDNAADSDQVRPLLPGTPTCGVLVTSRNRLSGLVARDGARRLELDVLPLAEARDLLRRLLPHRADGEGRTVTELAERCGRLPLALRIVAERAADRSDLSLVDLVAELADERHRLDALQADERFGVRTVFSWSLRHLDPEVARLFRLLGLHPGVDIDSYAAAALADTSVETAVRTMDTLRRAYLIQPSGPNRVGMHDLVRAYAAELAESQEDHAVRSAAYSRLFGFYLHGAGVAMDAFLPVSDLSRPTKRLTAHTIPAMDEPTAGLAWLDTELRNLVALSGIAAQRGSPTFATELSATIWIYVLRQTDDFQVALTLHENALRAARAVGDRAAEARALVSSGWTYYAWDQMDESLACGEAAFRIVADTGDNVAVAAISNLVGANYLFLGRYHEAAERFHESLVVHREFGDRPGEAAATLHIALIEDRLGHYDQALAGYRRSVHISEEIGDRGYAAVGLINSAALLSRYGRHDEALEDAQRARAMAQEAGNTNELGAINLMGYILCRLGRPQEALVQHQEALEFARRVGAPSGEADAMNGMGLVDVADGRYSEAVVRHSEALAIYRHLGLKMEEAETLNHLGFALQADGNHVEAVRHHRQAAAMARAMGDRYQLARALHGVAVTLSALGEVAEAEQHLAEATALFRELGLAEADRIAGTG